MNTTPCEAFWSWADELLAAPANAISALAGSAGTSTEPLSRSVEAEAAQTAAADDDATSRPCCPPPNWMPIAIGELGVTEYAGARMNPRIKEYFKASRFWGTDDSGGENAWCASLVAFVMKQAGHDIASDAFRAREWAERWSAGKKASRPVYGAIAVKTRDGGGHVGFVMGKVPGRPGYLAILGGNQGDATNVRAYPQSDFYAFMVPKDYDYSCCELGDYTGESSAKGSES